MRRSKFFSLVILFLTSLAFWFGLEGVLLHSRTKAEQPYNLQALQTANSQHLQESSHSSRQAPSAALSPGIARYSSGQYNEAITLWLRALELPLDAKDKAIIYSHVGAAYRQVGKLSKAVEYWEQAIQIYQVKKDSKSLQSLAEALADQAQAYNALGQFSRAISLSRKATEIARRLSDQKIEAVAQGTLGNAYSIAGEYDRALKAYSRSLKLAISLKTLAL